ncbi:MAG: S-layer homology domain-containing protein [Clostridiales bacterium]
MKKVIALMILCIILWNCSGVLISYGDTLDDVWLVSSMEIIDEGPFVQGQTITAEFTIRNLGLRTIYLDGLTISTLINSKNKTNFSWYRNIPIKSNETFTYSGDLFLSELGEYEFNISYKTYGDQWENKIKSISGILSEKKIQVGKKSVTKNLTGNTYSKDEEKVQITNNQQMDGEEIVIENLLKDVKGHWGEKFINELNLQGVIKGFPNGYFYPEKFVTKAEFAVLLCKGLLLEKQDTNISELDSLKNNWSYEYIVSTYEFFNNKKTDVNSFENREELVSALVNALNWNEEVDINLLEEKFTDYDTIDELNRKNIALALKKGLIKGYSDNTFRGKKEITRAEACKLIQNAQLIGGKSTIFQDYLNITDNDKVINEDNNKSEVISDDDKILGEEDKKKQTEDQEYSNTYDKTSKDGVEFKEEDNSIPNENPNNNTSIRKDRLEYIFGQNQYGEINFYTKEKQALENVVDVEIKVWDFDSSKKNKITKTIKITVNKKIADVVKIIFENIYNDSEKFPIKYIASYAWRSPMSSGRLSEHNYGTCLDINPSENPYIVNGKYITAGKWEPETNPYSIGTKSSVMKAFREYKWAWGGSDWSGDSQDYMHFSYLGH